MTRVHSFSLVLVTLVCLFAPITPAVARSLFVVGDSTASEYGFEQYPRMGWGQVLGDFYGEGMTVVDLAQSGRSAKSFINEGFFADLERQLGTGDILLIQFAHNDQKAHSPERYAPAETTFKEYLRKYVSLAIQKKAKPILLTPVVRRKFADGNLIQTHGKYPDAIRELALNLDVSLIDMTRLSARFVAGLGEQESKAIYLHLNTSNGAIEDNTHFSERGAYAMAALVARELESLQIVTPDIMPQKFIRVEQNGSGDFVKIQDAINSLDQTEGPATILIGPGDFEEQLFLQRDNITFAGSGRDRTKISATILRATWRETHDDDWGASTVNIKASDITFMNLTVINDYGIRYNDNSHQFALRLLEGSRIITENSTFITGGADTVSLWNKQDGMYYHRRAHFEGYTDFVCPRGWSYITDSTFFSHGGAAAIWHDGAADKSQKLVIRRSSFDGINGFILARRHYDAQFYLLNNSYSANMANTPIFRVSYEDTSRNRPNLWGDRYYFFGSIKEGRQFAWLEDNMPMDLIDIDPIRTFNSKWDPETQLARIKAAIASYEIREVTP